MSAAALQQEMLALEQALLHRDHRADAAALERLLTADFIEVNPAGTRSSRADVLHWLLHKDPAARWQLTELEVQPLAEGLRLVTYHALQTDPPRPASKGARHVSLWCFDAALRLWQLRFHQSTRVL